MQETTFGVWQTTEKSRTTNEKYGTGSYQKRHSKIWSGCTIHTIILPCYLFSHDRAFPSKSSATRSWQSPYCTYFVVVCVRMTDHNADEEALSFLPWERGHKKVTLVREFALKTCPRPFPSAALFRIAPSTTQLRIPIYAKRGLL